MRIAFMGTPEFAVPTLAALAGPHHVVRVYSQPPARAGRGKAVRPSAVHKAADGLGLEVATPERFRGDVVEDFAGLGLDAAVVVAYGQILGQAALDAPAHGCINLHASLLPRWRGAAPIQRAIMAGDAETGVCAMRMALTLDTGPVFGCARTEIGPEDTAGSLHDRLAAMGPALILSVIDGLEAGTAVAEPQAELGVTYAAKIDKAEARVAWERTAHDLAGQIRGLSPFPGAWCEIAGERVKLLMARAEPGDGVPGEVLDDRLLVACGEGAVRLTELQRQGGRAMDAETFLRGFSVSIGERLG